MIHCPHPKNRKLCEKGKVKGGKVKGGKGMGEKKVERGNSRRRGGKGKNMDIHTDTPELIAFQEFPIVFLKKEEAIILENIINDSQDLVTISIQGLYTGKMDIYLLNIKKIKCSK